MRQKKKQMTVDEFYQRELPTVAEMVTFCNSLPMSIYSDTTVVRSPEVLYRGLMFSQNRLLAEEFLMNSRRSEADLGVIIGTGNYQLPMAVNASANRDLLESDEGLIALPPFANERAPLGAVIRSRRSIRHYSGKPVSLRDLSTVLAHSAGITGQLHLTGVPPTETFGNDAKLGLRAAESGGGLYPIDLFFLAHNVESLVPGAYQYLPKQHALKSLPGKVPELQRLAQFQDIQADKVGLLLGYVYNLYENSRKYGESGLGFAFIETGAIAAHVHLLCTALGLGSCDVGSFSKRRFERLFGADGISRHMIHLTVIGKAGKAA